MNDEFFAKANELRQQGIPFATAIVVRAEKPTSAKPGDKAIITADGTMHGWIGGSCAQPTVIREALKALRAEEGRFVRLSPDPSSQPPRSGLEDAPMTCFSGGTLEIFIEPQQPQPRLIVVGHLPVARALAELAKAMNYRVILVEPAYHGPMPSYADQLITELAAINAQITPLTAVVVATHGQYDEAALEHVLRSEALYVGLVASPKRAGAVHEYLAAQGLTVAQLGRLKAPAGLNIRARRGDEIALSIMAEIVERRRSSLELAWPQLHPPAPSVAAATAIDPICGMSIVIEGAKYTHDYQGQTYYFCCPGCKTSFRKNPSAVMLEV